MGMVRNNCDGEHRVNGLCVWTNSMRTCEPLWFPAGSDVFAKIAVHEMT